MQRFILALVFYKISFTKNVKGVKNVSVSIFSKKGALFNDKISN